MSGGGDTYQLFVGLDRVKDVIGLTRTAEDARRLARSGVKAV